ncbi:hypothetical protein FB45DRAFT_1050528 [Roridomyces roridus]|uniref:MYND-type domain-containing protein n=1 Tax=Roridomyces roridus TaxID=1738132 RepID=A0AAD7CJM6_9AGAR|nr:hypothetical protein FB45DRAFT_1050528 [Roridomyces roridus]
MALPLYLSDDFAVVLALKQSDFSDRDIPEGNEFERWTIFNQYVLRNNQETQEQQDVIWSRFCAVYLPAMVDRLISHLPVPLDADEQYAYSEDTKHASDFAVFNPWHEMLVQVQHVPYIGKYLRSKDPLAAQGKLLPQVLAQRVAAVGARWDAKLRSPSITQEERDLYMGAATSAVQLLSTICIHFINEPDRTRVVARETQVKLGKILMVWSRRYRHQFLGDVSQRMLEFMSGVIDPIFVRMRRIYQNCDVCGLDSCQVRTRLMACSRCRTIRYCTPEHQRADWSDDGHKLFCFGTEY